MKNKATNEMKVSVYFEEPMKEEKNVRYVGLLTQKYFELVDNEENVVAISKDLVNYHTTIRTLAFFNILSLKEKLDRCLLESDNDTLLLDLLHKISRQIKDVPKKSEDGTLFGEYYSDNEMNNIYSLNRVFRLFHKEASKTNTTETMKTIHYEKCILIIFI